MIISMKLHSSGEEIEQVCERIRDFGYKIHAIEGEERVVIGGCGCRRCHRVPGIYRGYAAGGKGRAHFGAL